MRRGIEMGMYGANVASGVSVDIVGRGEVAWEDSMVFSPYIEVNEDSTAVCPFAAQIVNVALLIGFCALRLAEMRHSASITEVYM